jgi:hypothetical protein
MSTLLLSTIGRHDYIAYEGNIVSIDKILGLIYKGNKIGDISLIDKESFNRETEDILEQVSNDLTKGVKHNSYAVKSPLTPIVIDIEQSEVKEAYCCSICDNLVAKDGSDNEVCPKHNTDEHLYIAYMVAK